MTTALASPPESDWRSWPVEDKRLLLRRLREQVHGNWREHARPEQLPPDGRWLTLFLTGGRGSGKSWAGSHIFREMIESDPIRGTEGPGTWAVVAPTFGDARSKCIESEESGLLAAFDTTRGEVEAGTSPTVATWNRSIGELYLHDGTRVVIDGADDGAYRIQGENLRGSWCDEVGLWKRWKTAWDESLAFALRKGEAKRVATGTPKRNLPARALVKRLLADERVVSRQLLTRANWHNLSEAFRQEIGRFAGTELGKQELEGLLIEEAEGALWLYEWIESLRIDPGEEPGEGLWRVKVMGLDPSDGKSDGAEEAWTEMGLALDHRIYITGSEGMRVRPRVWLRKAIMRAREIGAVLIIERNHGGEFLVDLLEQVMKDMGVRVPYQMVWASKGKTTRAEPLAMLYEQSVAPDAEPKIHHVGAFPELEDQMIGWTGAAGEVSPDRLDSACWAAHHIMGYRRGPAPPDADKAVPYKDSNGRRPVGGAVEYR